MELTITNCFDTTATSSVGAGPRSEESGSTANLIAPLKSGADTVLASMGLPAFKPRSTVAGAQNTAFSRLRVQSAFQEAVLGAMDAPKRPLGESLGHLLYLAHLGIVLWWLLDRSPGQGATKALVALIRQMLPSAALTLHLRPVRGFVQSADALFREALLGEELQER